MNELIKAINELKKEKNAIILGHYYQKGEIQDIADYVGDSLALAQWAAKTEADITSSACFTCSARGLPSAPTRP